MDFSLGTTGKIEEVHYDKKSFSFEWRIQNFSLLSGNEDQYFLSPRIKVLNIEFHLRIYPNDYDEWIGIGITSLSDPKPSGMSFGIKDVNGIIEDICHNEAFDAHSNSWRFKRFLQWTNLHRSMSRLTPSDILTVTFIMRRNYPLSAELKFISREAQTEEISNTAGREKVFADLDIAGVATIRKHLEDLLLTGDDHDVILKIKDQEFSAHKCMLRARSPVFAAMFKHQMKESQNDSINIEDCDPDVFEEFLKYVYSAKVEDLSASKAMGLYYAGDKYDFSGLKEICVEFLKASLSTTVICDVITLAKNHGERDLLDHAVKFFTENTIEILTSVEWQCFAKNNFVAANELYIKAFNTTRKK